MDLLLQDSTLINNFTDETERAEALQDCRERFRRTYETYSNTTQPTEAMMEKVIDMYLFLGIEPSTKLMEDVKKFLLEGKTFSKLDIYMHLPEYDQVVKLLRPEYYAEVDPRRFNQFTASETIYNLASASYTIEDKYENAYSIWYMQRLKTKGVSFKRKYIKHLMEHSSWECVKLIIESTFVDPEDLEYHTYVIPTGEVHKIKQIEINLRQSDYMESIIGDKIQGVAYLLRVAIEVNNMDAFKYLLKDIGHIESTVKKLISLNRTEMLHYIGPLASWTEDNEKAFINSLTAENLRRIKDISQYIFNNLTESFIELDFTTGIEFAIDNNSISVEHLLYAYLYNRKYLKTFYDILAKDINPIMIFKYHSSHDDVDFVKAVYDLNPVDVNLAFDPAHITQESVVDFCIEKGLIITEQQIIRAMSAMFDWDIAIYLMKKYGMIHYSFMETAIEKNITSVIEFIAATGYPLHPSFVNLALNENKYDVVSCLLRLGCPVHHKDVSRMPSIIHDRLKVQDSIY